ncbi:MAG: thiamine-phosphate kinase [Fibrobacterota bacterium]
MTEENKVIKKISDLFSPIDNSEFVQTIGDDCAVRRVKKGYHLYSADALVEDVHFRTDYMSFFEIGRKAAAVNISDIAAMGGVPDSITVQLIFPPRLTTAAESIEEIYRGMYSLCAEYSITLAGGDLSRGPCWILACSIVGISKKPPLYRHGARPGDGIWVTGHPGRSSLGLELLLDRGRNSAEEISRDAVNAHVNPQPRPREGTLLLGKKSVSSMIDISDGVIRETRLLCRASRTGAHLFLPEEIQTRLSLPVAHHPPHQYFLTGGEDYELLFTASAGFSPPADVSCLRIGTITKEQDILFEDAAGMRSCTEKGWDHFA